MLTRVHCILRETITEEKIASVVSGRRNQSLNNTTLFSPTLSSLNQILIIIKPLGKNNAWNMCLGLHSPTASLPQIFMHNRWMAF